MNFKDTEVKINYQNKQVAENIYNILLDLIIRGQISQDEFIPINTVSEELNVSNTPVREALSKLTNDGIVTKIPYKGYKVIKFKFKLIVDVYETRAAIESYACKLTTKIISDDTINYLKRLQEKGELYFDNNDLDKYKEYNNEIHNIIITETNNDQILRVYKNIDNIIQALIYQTVYFAGRPQTAVKEHAKLIDLIYQRKAEEAANFMEEHILNTIKYFKKTKPFE